MSKRNSSKNETRNCGRVKEAEMPVVEFYISLDSKQKECTEKIIEKGVLLAYALSQAPRNQRQN